jgi:hypothetical protein
METKDIKIEDIKLDKNQPRKEFDSEKLKEMAETFKTQGTIQPIEVDEDKKQQERTQQSAYISEGIDDFLVASGDDDGGGVSKEADESVDISAVSQTVGVGRHRSDDGAILDMLRGKRQYTFICGYAIACIK